MQKVVVMSEKEYDDLAGMVEEVSRRMNELEEVVDDKDRLQEYIKEWLN